MNIKDVQFENLKAPEGDLLTMIFKGQEELEKKYRPIEEANGKKFPSVMPVDLDTFDGQAQVRDTIYRITEELYEMGNCMRNKAWKQTHMATDKDHFYEELSDFFHFSVKLFLELGLSPEQLTQLYFRKNAVNTFRQRSAY